MELPLWKPRSFQALNFAVKNEPLFILRSNPSTSKPVAPKNVVKRDDANGNVVKLKNAEKRRKDECHWDEERRRDERRRLEERRRRFKN